MVLLLLLHLVNPVVAAHQTQEQISIAHEQLWQCALQIADLAALQERNRIARDLHDSLGYALTALNIQLQTAVKLWKIDPTQAQTFLAQAQRLGAIAIKEVRQSVSDLRADAIEEQSLEALIQSVVEDFRQATGVSPSISIGLSALVPQEVVTTLYRILQEALNNICKYAAATDVQIQLSATSDKACLTVTDNGRGFKLDENITGFGLRCIQERVAALRGNFHLKTQPGAGCQIHVELPLLEPNLQEQEKPERAVSIVPAEIKADSQPCSVLSLEQYSRLEEILIKLIGPIAPILLQQVSEQMLSLEELVENLALHLSEQQRVEFEEKVEVLLRESTVKSQIRSGNSLGLKNKSLKAIQKWDAPVHP